MQALIGAECKSATFVNVCCCYIPQTYITQIQVDRLLGIANPGAEKSLLPHRTADTSLVTTDCFTAVTSVQASNDSGNTDASVEHEQPASRFRVQGSGLRATYALRSPDFHYLLPHHALKPDLGVSVCRGCFSRIVTTSTLQQQRLSHQRSSG